VKFCSFICDQADNRKAQHAACLAVNGVFCGILLQVIEKGIPCPVERLRKLHPGSAKDPKKKRFK
jgi:hypothetical protein